MGCDYYSVKALEITLKEERIPLLIELERDYGYFDFFLDSTDPDYETIFDRLKQERLKSGMLPIVIYENGDFMNSKLKQKYGFLVEEELFLNKRGWEEIIQIVKMEYRYERD